MPAGQQPTFALLNNQLTANALQMRDLMARISDLHLQVAKLGVAGLEALPDAPADPQAAPDLLTGWDDINTPAALYFGTAALPAPYNFNDKLATARAGQ